MTAVRYSGPERQVWVDQGTQKGPFGDTQRVLEHDPTRTTVTLSTDGQGLFNDDGTFRDVLADWATEVASGRGNTTVHSHGSPTQFNCAHASGENYRGGISFASGYRAEKHPGIFIKAFDDRPRQASIQFQVMNKISNILRDAGELASVIGAPMQYAHIRSPKRPKASVAMERLDSLSHNLVTRSSQRELDTPETSIEVEALNLALRSAIGGLSLITNDLAGRNWHFGRPNASATGQDKKWYVIDQPQGKIFELSRLVLPLARLAAK